MRLLRTNSKFIFCQASEAGMKEDFSIWVFQKGRHDRLVRVVVRDSFTDACLQN